MSNINKQALREAGKEELRLRSVSDTSDAWQDEASPEAVLALLDELEAKDTTIAFQQHEIRTLLGRLENDNRAAAAGKGATS